MFVVTLRFAAGRSGAARAMEEHKAWLGRGFDDGIFLLAGSLRPNAGGAIIAHDVTRAELEARVLEDPFVKEGVVSADILEIAPGRVDERLAFLRVGG